MILTIIFTAMAAACYGITSRLQHGDFKYGKDDYGFWGPSSGYRKYRTPRKQAPDNWYYRLLKIEYKEKFPLSASALVFVTDGFHLVQFFTIKFLIAAIIFYDGPISLW